jgi:APA family basic amino acid/polyamine antiporter
MGALEAEVTGEAPPAGDQLARVLGARDAAAIMISNMIGVGILTLPGMVALSVGNFTWALIAWALGGLVSLAGALVQAELGCRHPHAGGDYVFLREAFGKLPAFLSGWSSFVVGFPGAIAASSMAAANGLLDAAGASKDRWLLFGLALGLLVGISAVHSSGLEWGKRFQNSLVGLKLAILVFLVAAGLFLRIEPRVETGASPGGAHLATAAFFILFAYSGWNSAAYVAGEVRDPRRNLPRALIAGVLVVTGLYLLVNLAYFRVVPLREMGNNINILGEVARRVLGQWGGQAASLGLTLVFAGSASAMILTGPRIYYAMACDGLFPRALTRIGKHTRVPTPALWLQSLWAAGILLAGTLLTPEGQGVSDTFERIVGWTIFAILPFAALTAASAFVLRRRDPSPPFASPGYPWTALVFVGAAMAVEATFIVVGLNKELSGEWADRNWTNVIIGSLLVASGVPAYFLWTRLSRRPGGARE